MMSNLRVTIVLPAYNAEKTLEKTLQEIPYDIVDDIILVDDKSTDSTFELAEKHNIFAVRHESNLGYGANQKTCYRLALARHADIVVMLHPDYQYSPKLVTAMASLVASGEFDVVIGSRILGVGALKGGMPVYKYVANRMLTFIQNIFLGHKLSEYHTGYRAWSRRILERIPIQRNSDDFIFDNEMLCQAIFFGYRVGEISSPTRYFPEASSISFWRSVVYGVGVLSVAVKFRLHKMGIIQSQLFSEDTLEKSASLSLRDL